MKKAVAVIGLVAIVVVIGVWWVAFRQGSSVAVAAADIQAIELLPFPEGPQQPGFTSGVPDRFHVPIQLVAGAIPEPLPGPLRQGISCGSGAEVVFQLVDGRSITYGLSDPRIDRGVPATASAAINDYISKTPSTDAVGAGMLALAQAGRFQHPPDGMSYAAPTDCRVDAPHGFDEAPVYLCAISIVGQGLAGGHLWECGALVDGMLHTHRTDPAKIPTITGPWDPPWQPA